MWFGLRHDVLLPDDFQVVVERVLGGFPGECLALEQCLESSQVRFLALQRVLEGFPGEFSRSGAMGRSGGGGEARFGALDRFHALSALWSESWGFS